MNMNMNNNNKNDVLTDLEYINHMIPHHQLAVDMSKQIIPYTKSDIIIALSRDIIRKQNYEIWEMTHMKGLYDYSISNEASNKINVITSIDNPYYPLEDTGASNQIKSKSYMKEPNMKETQYLQHMIPHHQIAIDMSEQLLLYTKNPYLMYLANNIIIDQKKEIFFMSSLLNKNNIFYQSELLNSR